jgi:hypothetical protein
MRFLGGMLYHLQKLTTQMPHNAYASEMPELPIVEIRKVTLNGAFPNSAN